MSGAATEVRERPILFSGPMVRAILEGKKTQTRRVLKPQPSRSPDHFALIDTEVATGRGGWQACGPRRLGSFVSHGPPVSVFPDGEGSVCADILCPFGSAGTRLWVRETWCAPGWSECPPSLIPTTTKWEVEYRATIDELYREGTFTWRPSIFMPRWASRITLEVTDVRVERLNEITPEDCRAEGVEVPRCGCEPCAMTSTICTADASEYLMTFRDLWDSINGKRAPWDSNPWVWVVSFKRVESPDA